MIRYLYIFICFFGISASLDAQHLSFIENRGQWGEDFDYKLLMRNASVFLDQNSLTVHLVHEDDLAYRHEIMHGDRQADTNHMMRHHAYKVSFLDASSEAPPVGTNRRSGYHNYFLGNDPDKWQSKTSLFGEVSYKNLYPGIDLRYYFSMEGNLKYDLVVHPGADPSKVKLLYEGVDGLELSNGHLMVKTSVQDILEEAPYAYQVEKGEKLRVGCGYRLQGNELTFDLEKYDDDKLLIIDPKLIFSTYTGSTADNWGYTATYSEDGGLYAGGIVFLEHGNYPISLGSYQIRSQGGGIDIAISKFSSDGSDMIYSTFLGGDSEEMPYSLYETANKALVIMGSTGSSNFPVTSNAYSSIMRGGKTTPFWSDKNVEYSFGSDMFFTILDSAGGNLLGSTYFGGSGNDGFNAGFNYNYGDIFRGEVIADEAGNIYGVSSTESPNLPMPDSNAFMTDYQGDQDGFVCSFNSDLSELRWSSYLGGANDDNALSLKKGLSQDVYVVGASKSSNMSVGTGGYYSHRIGGSDGYIVRLDDANGSFLNGTFNGTSSTDVNFFTDVDYNGDVYIMGQTWGNYQVSDTSVYSNTGSAQFLQKFTADLSTSLKSTSIGDGNHSEINISPTAFMVDDCRNVYLSGWGGGQNNEGNTFGMPVTKNAFQKDTDGDDFYFLVLDATWEKLNYASFFGGDDYEHVDGGTSRFAKDGTIYHAVCGGCSGNEIPTTEDAFARLKGSGQNECNLAALKMRFEATEVVAKVRADIDSSCIPYTAKISNLSYNGDVYTWKLPNGQVLNGDLDSIEITDKGLHTFRMIATDTTCGFVDSTELLLHGFEDSIYTDFSVDYDSCSNDFKVYLINNSFDADIFEWHFGDGKTSVLKSPNHRFTEPGSYKIRLFGRNSHCELVDSASAMVYFRTRISSDDFTIDYLPCEDGTEASFTASGTGFQEYSWDFGDGTKASGSSAVHHFEEPGTYHIRLSLKDTICDRFLEKDSTFTIHGFDYEPEMANTFTPNADGINDYFGLPTDLPPSYFSDYSLKIFNRWGTSLYQSVDLGEAWNGTCENRQVPEGVYFYLLNFTDQCNNSREYKGYVHLFR